jgi:multiple antibiotic resistance protein
VDFKALVTLLAIVNPLAVVPFFIHYTQGFSEAQRKRTIYVASMSSFAVIALSALLGLNLLEFFGISLPSFQVGGGMLLLTSALAMLNAQPAEAKSAQEDMAHAEAQRVREQAPAALANPQNATQTAPESAGSANDTNFVQTLLSAPSTTPEQDTAQSAARTSVAVVPLTIPLLTGPATMSTVVIYAERAKGIWPLMQLVIYGAVIAAATAICFSLAQPIARVLGKTGINVMTRLMGLILAALAVEVMADGLQKLFPALAR